MGSKKEYVVFEKALSEIDEQDLPLGNYAITKESEADWRCFEFDADGNLEEVFRTTSENRACVLVASILKDENKA